MTWAVSAVGFWQTAFWVLVHGSAVAIIALVLSETVLRRARPAVIAALWSVVLLKFLVPVGPAMPWSLSSLLDGLFGGGARLSAVYAMPDLSAAPGQLAPQASIRAIDVLAVAGLALWLVAVVLIAARRIQNHVAARRLANAGAPAPAELVAVVASVARRIGLARSPEVRISPDGVVPWVVGLRRPILVLPAALADGPGPDLAAVVGHELAHLRRRDAWLRLVQVVAGTLFFFWPVVRWVNRRIDAARELACDAWAIDRGPLAAPEYARVLVRTARLIRSGSAVPAAALGLAAHPHFLSRRVDALLARPPRAGVGVGGIALLGAWIVVSLAGVQRAEARPTAAHVSATCTFNAEIAAAMLASHPEADSDGDGYLTRNEACVFQLEWALLSTELPADESLQLEELCCNCGEIEDRCSQDQP